MAGEDSVDPVDHQSSEWDPQARDIGCDRTNRFYDLDTPDEDLEL